MANLARCDRGHATTPKERLEVQTETPLNGIGRPPSVYLIVGDDIRC